MNVLLDTPVWSALFRRSKTRESASDNAVRNAATELIQQGRARIIGPVRQELLSGVRDHGQFLLLRDHMRGFQDEAMLTQDFEEAAALYNTCRSSGVTGSTIDLLLCAVSIRNKFQLFSLDCDFQDYAKIIPIRLYKI